MANQLVMKTYPYCIYTPLLALAVYVRTDVNSYTKFKELLPKGYFISLPKSIVDRRSNHPVSDEVMFDDRQAPQCWWSKKSISSHNGNHDWEKTVAYLIFRQKLV